MKKLSSSDAFLILGKWRDEKSQVQINFLHDGKQVGSPLEITEVSQGNEAVVATIVLNGQKTPCDFDFSGASFQYGEPLDTAPFPEFAEGKWESYLLIECPSGRSFLFAARLVK